jgi:putative ABC transport system permease protein
MLTDLRFAMRSLARAKGLSATVVLTLALGIGANAAIFSVVRGVLLRPLANQDESRLLYIRQSAQGNGVENATFSVPEINDLRARVKTLSAIGDFSTIGFTMVGLGEPRQVRAGVVGGNYFDVMGLRPVLGRLLNVGDDGPSAAGAAVLTHRFWTTDLQSDPAVLGKTIRLGTRSAVIVGVLGPSVPYPAETELIANVVTSPHHLSATMVTGREHRMTEVFGRLAPGANLETAKAELRAVQGAIVKEHPESYSAKADFRINAVPLRDQITSRARPVLLLLLLASGLVFVIACSNVANLILARTLRRESELTVRAALGASAATLRRTLLAESVLLCGAGAVLGIVIARPMVAILARYASRYSVRALDLTLDPSLVWVGAGLALAAAILLAFVPRLPSSGRSQGLGLSSGSHRVSSSTTRRLRVFAVTQIAASFVLLAGAGMLLQTLLALQAARPGFETKRVLAVNVPVMSFGRTPEQIRGFYREVQRRLKAVPGVDTVAVGSTVPWRDAQGAGGSLAFTVEGRARAANGADDPRARFRSVSPGFFAALGIPLVAGRDFTDADRLDAERVVIISASLAQQLFPGQDPLNRHLLWTDPIVRFINVSAEPRRIVGVATDIDDGRIDPEPVMAVYHPFEQELGGGRLFVHARTEPYALVPIITRTVRELAADQPVERASTLEDVRAEVLAPNRLNTLVFGGFAAVALAISIVGVAGVLAFSVSGRTREFGIRMAVGSQPRRILVGVLTEGIAMAVLGVAAGAAGGFALQRLLGSYVQQIQLPGVLPVIGSALALIIAAVVASVLPAARAARVDVMTALRTD